MLVGHEGVCGGGRVGAYQSVGLDTDTGVVGVVAGTSPLQCGGRNITTLNY